MKIERFLFGMFDGKIGLAKTDGVTELITDTNFQFLRELTVEPEDGYLWLPTEQVIAFPHIMTVSDGDGRQFVQNETFLIPIHDYIKLTKDQMIRQLNPSQERDSLPGTLEPVEISIQRHGHF